MKNIKKIMIILIIALIFTSIYTKQPIIAYASDSSNITKMLNSYKKHNYTSAKKYLKKIKSTKIIVKYKLEVVTKNEVLPLSRQ